MTCHRCGEANADSALVCSWCGEPIQRACSQCQAIIAVAARFCAFCGSPADPATAEGWSEEVRPLTVVFCDLVDSTGMSQRLDPEDMRDVLHWYHAVCNQAVQANAGHIGLYLGDGVVAYFGYPTSGEDDAQRAVQCGLEIITAMGDQTSRFEHLDTAIAARIGIHTGRVMVSAVGDTRRRDPLAVGDTPNVAARVQAEAEPGTVLVTETTWTIVQDQFVGAATEPRTLKGVKNPMRLWRIVGDGASSAGVAPFPGRTPFVGRVPEFDALADVWRRSQRGEPAFVLVRGDPGIGKSRLVSQFADRIQPGVRHLIMRGQTANKGSPFAPVVDLLEQELDLGRPGAIQNRIDRLRQSLANLGVDDVEDISVLDRLISGRVAELSPDAELSPEAERARAMNLLLRLLALVAARAPTMLIADDLQWADPSTLELLGALVQDPPAVALLGLFTARPDFNPDWCRPGLVDVIELSPLGREDTEALIRSVASGKALPGEITRRIDSRSSGVPLFAEALTRAVLDSGALRERSASWEAVGPVSAASIPLSVDASLTARIDRLGSSRPTALLAAVIGNQFSLDLLSKVSRRDEAALDQDVQQLAAARVVYVEDTKRQIYSFSHALLRDAAYSLLPRRTRRQYHRTIADALSEGASEEPLARPDLVAYHLSAAGEHEEAVRYWKLAGTQAAARACYSEAAHNLREALSCLDRVDASVERDERELEMQMLLSPLLMTVYGWGSPEVERAVTRSVVLAERLERPMDLSALRWGVWSVRLLQGDMVGALAAAKDVKDAVAMVGPLVGPMGHNAMALTLWHRAEFEELLKEADEGLSSCPPEIETALIQHLSIAPSIGLRASRATALWMLERPDEAGEDWSQMLQRARSLEHRPTLANALVYTLQAECFRHSHDGSLQHLLPISEELTVLCEEFYFWAAANLACRGVIEQTLGHPDVARTMMLEGLELFEQTGARCGFVHMAVFCAEAFCRMGDDSEALRLLDQAEQDSVQRHEGLFAPEIWRVRGTIAARAGAADQAESLYREAIRRAHQQSARPLELRAALSLHDLLLAGGDEAGAVAELEAVVDGVKSTSHLPELERVLAALEGHSWTS